MWRRWLCIDNVEETGHQVGSETPYLFIERNIRCWSCGTLWEPITLGEVQENLLVFEFCPDEKFIYGTHRHP